MSEFLNHVVASLGFTGTEEQEMVDVLKKYNEGGETRREAGEGMWVTGKLGQLRVKRWYR